MRKKLLIFSIILTVNGLLSQSLSAVESDAGAVGNYTEILCMDKTETSVEMTIENLRSANYEGHVTYAYLLNYVDENGGEHNVDTLNIDSENLLFAYSPANYPQIALPATFYLKRIVSTDLITWHESDGKGIFTVAQNEYSEQIVEHCINDLPFSVTYTYYDGREETCNFNENKLEHILTDRTALGCVHQHTIRCVLTEIPIVEVETIGHICQSANTLDITYQIVKGTPDACRISFDAAAYNAGFRDTIIALTDEKVLSIDMPTAQNIEYEISLQFFNTESSTTCHSDIYSQHFTLSLDGYVHQKWNDVLFVDNNDKNCLPDCESDLLFSAYQWYKNGKAIDGATEQVYYEKGGLNGLYYVILTDTLGNQYRSCEIERRPIIEEQNLFFKLTPALVQGGETITIQAEKQGQMILNDMMGRIVYTVSVLQQEQQMVVPNIAGIYIATFTSISGERESIKLIVR